MVLRAESGELCGNLYYAGDVADRRTVYRKNEKLYCYGKVRRESKWLIPGAERQLYAEKYLLDDTAFVRAADLMKEDSENEQ